MPGRVIIERIIDFDKLPDDLKAAANAEGGEWIGATYEDEILGESIVKGHYAVPKDDRLIALTKREDDAPTKVKIDEKQDGLTAIFKTHDEKFANEIEKIDVSKLKKPT